MEVDNLRVWRGKNVDLGNEEEKGSGKSSIRGEVGRIVKASMAAGDGVWVENGGKIRWCEWERIRLV